MITITSILNANIGTTALIQNQNSLLVLIKATPLELNQNDPVLPDFITVTQQITVNNEVLILESYISLDNLFDIFEAL